MINWETLAAACVCLTALCGLFIYIVRGIVTDAIHTAVNGFRTEQAVQKSRIDAIERSHRELHEYTHNEWHDQINKTSDALLESFRAGRTAGLLSKQGD